MKKYTNAGEMLLFIFSFLAVFYLAINYYNLGKICIDVMKKEDLDNVLSGKIYLLDFSKQALAEQSKATDGRAEIIKWEPSFIETDVPQDMIPYGHTIIVDENRKLNLNIFYKFVAMLQ